MKRATTFAALAVVAALGITAAATADTAESATATQPVMTASAATLANLTPCESLPALPTARCGVLNLPLDRSHPQKGTTPVAFALVPHTDTSQPGWGRSSLIPEARAPGPST